ncbi:MAG: serine hydrolase [Chloroflexi bacterium]|nr:serine hydrolase [Chloroflexota bacterium]
MNTRIHKSVVTVLLILMSALAVIPFAGAQEGGEPDYWPTAGWRTSTPEEQGMDSAGVLAFLDRVGAGIHSVLVVRHGAVVLDASVPPYSPDQPHYLASVTKVLTSTLLGMAIERGYVQGVDQSIWDFFSKEETANMDARKEAITIKHLLTQTSGFDFGFGGDWLLFSVLTEADQSWVQFLLDRQMATEPGTTFNYMDGNPLLVSAIIGQTTGMPADEFARQNLFDPLGVGEVLWLRDPQGVSQGGDRCFIGPYDMAKLGYLYLRNGEWDGEQIIPAPWVEEATASYITPHYLEGYGYYWYSGSFGGPRGYAALGAGGQEIWVIPDLDLVVVLTGDLTFNGLISIVGSLVPAVQSETALPENPEAYAALQAKVDALSNPAPTAAKLLPEIAGQITGKTYTLAVNDLGWKTASLVFGEQEATLTLELADRTLELPIGLDGVARLSTSGLPIEPVARPVDNVPLAAKGGWKSEKTFVVTIRDTLGLVDAEIMFSVGEALILQITPNMGFMSPVTIRGTMQ